MRFSETAGRLTERQSRSSKLFSEQMNSSMVSAKAIYGGKEIVGQSGRIRRPVPPL
jgi:hypothetical protein